MRYRAGVQASRVRTPPLGTLRHIDGSAGQEQAEDDLRRAAEEPT
jgi:hypothetical protein